ncbi:helix-turn-helix domain-containing protein [Paenibacillus alvei]|nr:helix-turn-helix domain-containing protein [Paenibacillus alvei]
MTQGDLAELLGVGVSTVSDWEKAKKLPRAGVIENISSHFNIPKSKLFEEENGRSYMGVSEVAMVPVIKNVLANEDVVSLENVEKFEATPLTWVSSGEYYYIKANGDSMVNARIFDGDLLLIQAQDDVEEGEIAAVLLNGEIVLKRIFKNGGIVVLHSENPNYSPIFGNDESCSFKIIGKLKKILIDM